MKSTSHARADSRTQRNQRSGQVGSRRTTTNSARRVTPAADPGSHVHLLPMDVAREVKVYMAFCRSHGIKSTPMGMATWCRLFHPDMYRKLLEKCNGKRLCYEPSCRTVWAAAKVIIPGDYRASGFTPYGTRALDDKLRNAVGQTTDDRRRLDWGELPSEFMNPLRPRRGRRNGFRFGRAKYNANLHALMQGPTIAARVDRFVRVIQPRYRNMTYRDLCLRLADRYMIPGLRAAIESKGKLLFGDFLDAPIGNRPSQARERKIVLRAARREKKKVQERQEIPLVPLNMNKEQMNDYIQQLISDYKKLHPEWSTETLNPFWSGLTALFKSFGSDHPQYRSICRVLAEERKKATAKPKAQIQAPPVQRLRSLSNAKFEPRLNTEISKYNDLVKRLNKFVADDLCYTQPEQIRNKIQPRAISVIPPLPEFLKRNHTFNKRVRTKYRDISEIKRIHHHSGKRVRIERMKKMNKALQAVMDAAGPIQGLKGGLHEDLREVFLGVDSETGLPVSPDTSEDEPVTAEKEEIEPVPEATKDLIYPSVEDLKGEHTLEELAQQVAELEALDPISDLPTDDSRSSSGDEFPESADIDGPIPTSVFDGFINSKRRTRHELEMLAARQEEELRQQGLKIDQLWRMHQRLMATVDRVLPFFKDGLKGGMDKGKEKDDGDDTEVIYLADKALGLTDGSDNDEDGDDDDDDNQAVACHSDDKADDGEDGKADKMEEMEEDDADREWEPEGHYRDPHNESTDFLPLEHTHTYSLLPYLGLLTAVGAATKYINKKFGFLFLPLICGLPTYRFFSEHFGTYHPEKKEVEEVRRGKNVKKIIVTKAQDVRYLNVSPVNMDLVIGRLTTQIGLYSPFFGWTFTLHNHSELYNDTIVRGYAHDTKGPMSNDDRLAYYAKRKNTVNQNVADVTFLRAATVRAMRILDYMRGLPVRAPLFAVLVGLSSAHLTDLPTKELKPDFSVKTFDIDVRAPSCWYSLLPYNEIMKLEYAPVVLDRFEQNNMVLGAINRIGVDNAVNIDLYPYIGFINDTIDELFAGFELREEELTVERIREWIDSRPYPANAKKQLHECLEDMRMVGLGKEEVEALKDWRTIAFIKNECYPSKKFARLICAGGSVRKLIYGPIFEQLSDYFFHSEWSMKKIPIYDRPDFITSKFPDSGHFYVTDHSAFECSATVQVQDAIEMQVYKRFLKPEHVPYLEYITSGDKGTGLQKIFSHLGVLIETPVVRNSGEMNTSLGNSILNAITAIVAFKSLGVKVLNFMVEGDDALILTDRFVDPDRVAEAMSHMGCRIKIDYYERFEHTSFCSTFFIDDRPTIDWTRNLIKIPWKDTMVRANHMQEMVDKIGSMVMHSTGSAISRALAQRYHPVRARFKNDSYIKESKGIKFKEDVDGSLVTNIPKDILRELHSHISFVEEFNDHATSGVPLDVIHRVVQLILQGKLVEAINEFYEPLDAKDRAQMTDQIQSFNPGVDNIHLIGRYFVAGQPGQNHYNKF